MRNALPVIIAAALTVACTGTTTPTSSSSAAQSSEAAVSSQSSVAPVSSSSAVSSSSSSAPMSSSSQAGNSCSNVDVSEGTALFKMNAFSPCEVCHGSYNSNQGQFPGAAVQVPINPNALTETTNANLEQMIATRMAAGAEKSCYDITDATDKATCLNIAKQTARYINSLSNDTAWCETASSSSSAPQSSSSQVASSSSSAPANAKVIYAINVGSTESATYNSVTYEAETGFPIKFSGDLNDVASTTLDISGTNEDKLFQSQRYGNYTFELPVTTGDYNVTLYFAESYAEMAGVRVMSATAEGAVILSNVDLYDAHNGRLKALTYTVNDVSVTDDNLTIDLSAVTNYATLSGILVTSVNGAKGEIVVPPSPCEGTDNYICLDFENVGIGSQPDGWGTDGKAPVVNSEKSHSGTKSLKASGSDYGTSGYITYRNIPSKHWGRMFYQMGSNLQTTNYLHITFVELLSLNSGFPVRVVDTNLGSSDLSMMKYILNIDQGGGQEGGLASPTKFSYYAAVDNWVCVEWMMDPTTQKAALWADGVEAYNAVLTYPSPNQIPSNSFDQIRIGLRTYKGAFNTVWLDDIVVGPNRIGCN